MSKSEDDACIEAIESLKQAARHMGDLAFGRTDTTARDAKARNLCVRLTSERRTETELDVIDLLLSGIESHEGEYGGCDAATDTRNCLDERDQEMQDGLFYHLLEAVKRRAKRRNRVQRFVDAYQDQNDRAIDWESTFDEPTQEFTRAGSPTSSTSDGLATPAGCSDCASTVSGEHCVGCPWITVVPANRSEVA